MNPAVSHSEKKGALVGRETGEPHRPLKKLDQVYDPRVSLARDEARRIAASVSSKECGYPPRSLFLRSELVEMVRFSFSCSSVSAIFALSERSSRSASSL
jgi:hypothetical protein